jgi:hypothetical protein
MSDDTIRYLADWAGLILMTGMAIAAVLAFFWIATIHAQRTKK